MLVDYLSPQRLKRLHTLAAARGQSVAEWIDQLIETAERELRLPARAAGAEPSCPLVVLAGDFLLRLCGSEIDVRHVAAALRAAVVDGERSHVGPLGANGLMLELSPQWEGVWIIVGEGRFVLSDRAALELADRLLAHCRTRDLAAWRPSPAGVAPEQGREAASQGDRGTELDFGYPHQQVPTGAGPV
jgi:hypothetical protein